MSQRRNKTKPSITEKSVAYLEEKAKKSLTVLWDQLPAWQRDNHYILSGYRPESGSYRKSIASLSHLHNETVNIFSHLVGAVIFAIIAFWLGSQLSVRYSKASRLDILVFGCFFAGAITCLGTSASFHTLSNHSQKVNRLWNRLDYTCICALIWGSFIPAIYYGFACDRPLANFYSAMITVIGAICAIVSLSPKFATPDWRPFRASMFVAYGLSSILPIGHGVLSRGIKHMNDSIALPWLVTQGALYIAGAAIYANRIPEKWKPGYFDTFGSSHQIFHFFVVAAALVHLRGLLLAFDYHHETLFSTRCAI